MGVKGHPSGRGSYADSSYADKDPPLLKEREETILLKRQALQ
jgi:hypothetical protein